MKGATLESADSQLRHGSATRRLVIVADNSLIVEVIRLGFRQSGEFRLVGYANGRETSASTILRADPEVILFDDMGRSERAIELLRELRGEDAEIPILVLSLNLDADALEEVFIAGATAVISKAVQPAALVTLVRETLDGHIVHRPSQSHPNGGPTPALAAADLPLTEREFEILQLTAHGSTNADIARQLWVTEQTVKFHLRNIYRKLDVTNRTQASHFAHANGLVGSPPNTVTGRRQLELVAAS